jgi:hypothetical protein
LECLDDSGCGGDVCIHGQCKSREELNPLHIF